MSALGRKLNLEKKSTPSGWIVHQTRADGAHLRGWVRFAGDAKATQLSPGELPAALVKAKSLGCFEKQVPAHWIALPTGLDLQVHLRHPGQPQKETLEGGLDSALAGGYDSIVTMPNTNPYLDTAENLAAAIASALDLAATKNVKVGFTASATQGMQGEVSTDIQALAKAGAVAITDDGWGVKNPRAQAEIFARCAQVNLLFQQHAEMPGHKGVAPVSPFQAREGLPVYPRTAESEMIRRDVALLRKHPGARYHVLHVSTRESLEEIRRAKSEGLKVTAEVTPHHLIFSNRDIPAASDERCTYFKMNPPLFDPEDRAALREALRDGTIDCVSTDHAPHEFELKQKGWLLAPFGTRGLETALPALLQLMHEGELSLRRLVEVFSDAPRAVLAHAPFAAPAGLLLVDPTEEWEVSDLPGISKNSCFVGSRLHGKLQMRLEADCVYSV